MEAICGQNCSNDGAEGGETAPGSRYPRQSEEVPTLHQIAEQIQVVQARLAKAEQELLIVRAERDVLLERSLRADATPLAVNRAGSDGSGRILEFKMFVNCESAKLKDNDEIKRKSEGSSRPSKKFKGGSPKSKGVKEKNEWCNPCKSVHSGRCSASTLRCNKCGNKGHLFKDCTDVMRCFKCKESGHRAAECPKKKDKREAESCTSEGR